MLDRNAEVLDVVTPGLLEVLGGTQKIVEGWPVVETGAFYLTEENPDRAAGIFRHVVLTSRPAYFLTMELMVKDPERFGDLNLTWIVQGAITHDVSKMKSLDQERLPPAVKVMLGIRPDFKETDPEAEEVGVEWLRNAGLAEAVYENIVDHFPQKLRDSWYWKIILLADYMTSQKVMPVRQRLKDVSDRWIDQRIAQGLEPKISRDAFDKAEVHILAVAEEIFAILGMTDEEFINKHELNNPAISQQPWEKLLNDRWKDIDVAYTPVRKGTMINLGIDPDSVDGRKKLDEVMMTNTLHYSLAQQAAKRVLAGGRAS